MKVTNEKTESNQAFLTVEMEAGEMEEAGQNVYRRLVRQVNVPGFRKGKAPRAVLERHLGQERLLDSLVDEVVPKAYQEAVQQEGLDAMAQPQIELVERDPVIFKAVVPLRPVVALGDYRGIRLQPEPVNIAEETVDAVVEQIRHQYSTWEPAERSVQMGDLVTMDVESTIDGEPFISQKGGQYQVSGDSTAPAPGFAEQIVGMNPGEVKEFEIDFPEDFARAELAGKHAGFRVTATEIKQERLPEVTDELAAQVDPEFKTAADMRERILADLTTRAEDREKQAFQDRVMDAIIEISEVSFPPLLVESEIHQMMDDQARRLQRQGLTMEQYLSAVNKTAEELHEEMHPAAETHVKRSLVLGKVAEQEGIEVTDAEIDAEMASLIDSASEERKGDMRRILSTDEARGSLRRTLLSRKTVQTITDIARGTIEPAGSTESVDPAEPGEQEKEDEQ